MAGSVSTKKMRFMKVLSTITSRKGGALLTVKDENQKFDPRFATVPWSPSSIEDAIAQAAKCRFALGVGKLRQGFAIRCRKENLQETQQFANYRTSMDTLIGLISR